MDASKLDLSALPELTVSLATEDDDVVLTMPACRYVNRVPKTSYCAAEAPPRKEDAYFFSVGPIEEGRNVILGQSLFESYYVAHDMGASPRVGFAPIRGCDADGCGVPAGARFDVLGSRWAVVAALVCLPLGAYIRWRCTIVAATTRRSMPRRVKGDDRFGWEGREREREQREREREKEQPS